MIPYFAITKLSGGYEAEQKELQEKVAILQAELTGQEEQAMNLDRFLTIVEVHRDRKTDAHHLKRVC